MQDELSLGLRAPAPAITADDVETVVSVLRNACGWMTAKQIAEVLGRTGASFERRVRAVASASVPRIVSFPGSPGYKLWDLCTIAEIDHCIAAFESQGQDMLKRAILYRRAYHQRRRCDHVPAQQTTLAV